VGAIRDPDSGVTTPSPVTIMARTLRGAEMNATRQSVSVEPQTSDPIDPAPPKPASPPGSAPDPVSAPPTHLPPPGSAQDPVSWPAAHLPPNPVAVTERQWAWWVITLVVVGAMFLGLAVVGSILLAVGDEGDAGIDLSTDHQTELMVGEDASVARYLVPVDGYHYVDDAEVNVERVLDLTTAANEDYGSDFFGAVALHGVVADDESQNTARAWNGVMEVGFLVLTHLNEPVPYGVDRRFLTGQYGAEPIDRLDISGFPVFVFGNPDRPDSRFTYLWLEHGVQGYFDGADRQPLERWLHAYLAIPKLAEGETLELAIRLHLVDGFAYSDVDPAMSGPVTLELAGVAHSVHHVADVGGAIGVLTLAETDDPTGLSQLAEGSDMIATGTLTRAGSAVEMYRGPGGRLAFVWTDGGASGMLTTSADDVDETLRFLDRFLESSNQSE